MTQSAIIPALLIATLALVPVQGHANDTTAELATGGLTFTKSQDIELRSEDLFISMKEIRVQYKFYNRSNRDVATHVAFPMPDLTYGPDIDLAIPTDDPENILSFITTVNNLPVAALVERKALLSGVDKTDVLQKLGVSVAPRPNHNHDYLSQETWDQLILDGLIEDTPRTDGYISPRWTLKTTYYWQQTFPAGQEISIFHRYAPSVGGVVPMPASDLLNQPSALQIDRSKGLNRFCINQDFLNGMARSSNSVWEQHFIEYILVTGANWLGPIRNFRLVVDKGARENLVSFCGRGVRKINATQFELRASDFTPSSNVSVLFLTPAQAELGSENTVGSSTDLASLSCNQLWYQRNRIFKAARYCFRTQRAIATFGNAGCSYDNIPDVPLPDRDRQLVNAMQVAERTKRCPR